MATLPSGPIRTPSPQGGSFGIDWERVTRWEPQARAAAAELNVPLARVMATVVIESGGNPDAVQRNDANGWSYGLMQVVPRWHQALIARLAGKAFRGEGEAGQAMLDQPSLALRAGCAVLRQYYDQHGTWDRASSAFFLGNPDWRGIDTVNGNTGAGYRRALDGLIAEYGEEETPVTDGINWEPLPRPAMVRAIVNKARDGDGFSRTTSRGPRTIGCCNHITDGDPAGDEIEFYRAFFSVGGERARDALVDTIIARDGQIGLLNDWEDDRWGGTRAGWANGGIDGLTSVGSAIVARYPGNQINEVFVSKEHVARTGQAITDAQMASSIALSAYVAQRAKVRWDTYPKNDAGLVVDPLHTDFAAKACPAEPFISTYYPVLVREVRAILTKHQTGSTNPNPTPVPPAFPGLPAWLPEPHLRAAFPLADPAGVVTRAVVAWAARTGRVPIYRETRSITPNSSLWLFDGVTFLHDGPRVWVEGESI